MSCENCETCQSCVECQIVGSSEMQNRNQQGQCQRPQVPQRRKIRELTLWNCNLCNFKCDYCFVHNYKKGGVEPKMLDEVINQLPLFIKKDAEPNSNIWFFGEEPLMGFDVIKKIYSTVSEFHPMVGYGMTTNGSILKSKDVAKWLGERRFGVLFSIDGWKESNDRHRKYGDGSGTWDDVWEGLLNTRLYIKNNPQIRWSYTPETVSTLADDFDKFLMYGFSNFAIEPVYEVPWNEEALRELEIQMGRMGRRVLYMRERGTDILLKSFTDVSSLLMAQPNNDAWVGRCGLVMNGGTVGVDVNGDLYPCHRFVVTKTDKVGSLKDGINWKIVDEIQGRWKGQRPYSEYGRSKCAVCPWLLTCNGGCTAVNLDSTGDWHKTPKSFCDIQNVLLKALYEPVLVYRAKFMKMRQMNPHGVRK